MKELSIKQKAKVYDEALERAKKLKETCDNNAVVGWMEYIFPELKESEGEKVRKMLIEFFSRGAECNSSTNGIPDKDIITWLEKHKYTEEDLDKAYKCADEVQYRRGYEDAKKEIEKQGEQKPADKIEQEYHCTGVREPKEATGVLKQLLNKENYAWSEEDEAGFADTLWAIQQARTIAKDENDMGNLWYAEHWLKSIKDRVQPQPQKEWKPTERMLEALKWAKCEFHPDCPETMEQLKYLYQELKQIYYDRT